LHSPRRGRKDVKAFSAKTPPLDLCCLDFSTHAQCKETFQKSLSQKALFKPQAYGNSDALEFFPGLMVDI
jgi:hypothetical protein